MGVEKKYKPVIINDSKYLYNRDNVYQQNLLLKSLEITSDPKKLKHLIGVRTVAEVFRTLDKIAMRQEYHDALIKNGVDLDTIIEGITDLCQNADKSETRLKGWQILLKSLGLDEYKAIDGAGTTSWEDELMKKIELDAGNDPKALPVYDVTEPEVPDDVKERIGKDVELGKELYG